MQMGMVAETYFREGKIGREASLAFGEETFGKCDDFINVLVNSRERYRTFVVTTEVRRTIRILRSEQIQEIDSLGRRTFETSIRDDCKGLRQKASLPAKVF